MLEVRLHFVLTEANSVNLAIDTSYEQCYMFFPPYCQRESHIIAGARIFIESGFNKRIYCEIRGGSGPLKLSSYNILQPHIIMSVR